MSKQFVAKYDYKLDLERLHKKGYHIYTNISYIFLKEVGNMKKQKVTFELDKKLDNATVDEIMYLLKDMGAKNIEVDWVDIV